jgi:hypothetical protein
MKTGSTYLQQCLTGAAPALAAQGVCYPTELLDANNKHMHLPVFSAVRRKTEAELRPIFERLNAAGYNTIVLSCEFMSKFGRDPLTRLRALTGSDDVEVVYAVRRWSDRIPSMWFQSLFAGSGATLPEYYVNLLNIMAKNGDIDYSIAWRKIADIFGRGSLKLFPYSTIMDRGEDIFSRFCTDVLHLTDVPKAEKQGSKIWSSFSLEDTEILRVLNAIYTAEHGKKDARMYWQLKRGRDALDTDAINSSIHAHLAELVLDENARHFDRTFRRMEEFADNLVGDGPIFDRKAVTASYAAPEYLLGAGVARQLHSIYAKFNAAAEHVPAGGDEESYDVGPL